MQRTLLALALAATAAVTTTASFAQEPTDPYGRPLLGRDNWVRQPGDIVVTADIPLADRSLKAGAAVIGNTGVPFTTSSIGMAMASRDLMSNLRAMGEVTGGPKPMTQRDRSRFLSALDETIQKLRRAK